MRSDRRHDRRQPGDDEREPGVAPRARRGARRARRRTRARSTNGTNRSSTGVSASAIISVAASATPRARRAARAAATRAAACSRARRATFATSGPPRSGTSEHLDDRRDGEQRRRPSRVDDRAAPRAERCAGDAVVRGGGARAGAQAAAAARSPALGRARTAARRARRSRRRRGRRAAASRGRCGRRCGAAPAREAAAVEERRARGCRSAGARSPAGAVVADLDLERVGAVSAGGPRRGRRRRCSRAAGQRVLDDAVGGDVEAGGQLALARPRPAAPPAGRRRSCAAPASARGAATAAARASRSASSRRSTPSRRRSSSSASRPAVSIAANAVARELRAGQREPARAGGLHGHRAQRVGDDVVQLAGDPRALVDDGAAGGVRAVALEQRGLLAQRAVERGAAAQQAADERPARRARSRRVKSPLVSVDVVVVGHRARRGTSAVHERRRRPRARGASPRAPSQ